MHWPAAAASAQGLQNLALGLRYRHYVPSLIGQRNRFDVADKPAWIEVGIVSLCFLAFGTDEETYLAVYAAGVFILLGMTGWAAVRRLSRQLRAEFSAGHLVTLAGTAVAATLISGATAIIFWERFFEGAWTFLVFIPVLYVIFTYFRSRLGEPTPLEKRLGRKYLSTFPAESRREGDVSFDNVLVPLDGSAFAEQSLSIAQIFCRTYDAHLTLMSIHPTRRRFFIAAEWERQPMQGGQADREEYLQQIGSQISSGGLKSDFAVSFGPVAEEVNALARDSSMDLIVMSTHGRGGIGRWLIGSVANKLIQLTRIPILLIRPGHDWRSRETQFKRLLVTLDGSKTAERVLPYARALATRFESDVLLLSVPDELASAGPGVRPLQQYLQDVALSLQEEGLDVEVLVTGSEPARTIVETSEAESTDLIMMATHGRGGLERLLLRSVADRVVRHTRRPVFLVPIRGL